MGFFLRKKDEKPNSLKNTYSWTRPKFNMSVSPILFSSSPCVSVALK